ncbi:MAG: DUF1552 domain-containing protein [Deltaproteobacteria bacterium]|nr:DUF1552 domain-containing protein [Deltaproteobacteria bacterium]
MNRRTFLTGSASATALGLLCTRLQRTASAQGVGRPRFIFIYTPSGREPSWRTGTPGPNFKLGPTMSMFEPYKSKMCLLEGFTGVNFGYQLNAHWASLHCLLGGKAPLQRPGNSGGGLSEGSQRTFDHLLADRIGRADPVKNVVVGGSDRDNDNGSLAASWSGPKQVQLPVHDPDKVFASLFAGNAAPAVNSTDLAARQKQRMWEKDVLGLSREHMQAFSQRLGAQERQQLQAYESHLADALQTVSATAPDIAAEAKCLVGKYEDVTAGLPTESYMRQHDLQSRVLAAGLACGRTSVGVYVMAGLRAGMRVPGSSGGHHLHDDGAVGHYRAFDTYYGNRVKTLLDELSKYPEGDGTVLDNTTIVWSSDISWTPVEHDHDNLPIYLFGGTPNRKLKMGQYVKMPSVPGPRDGALANPKNRRLHEVLLTIAQAMGFTDLNDFADPKYVQGPVQELLSG